MVDGIWGSVQFGDYEYSAMNIPHMFIYLFIYLVDIALRFY